MQLVYTVHIVYIEFRIAVILEIQALLGSNVKASFLYFCIFFVFLYVYDKRKKCKVDNLCTLYTLNTYNSELL